MSTEVKKESIKSKQSISVMKVKNLKSQARVRPILKDKGLTEDFFAGKKIEVTQEQFDALLKRKWIEV